MDEYWSWGLPGLNCDRQAWSWGLPAGFDETDTLAKTAAYKILKATQTVTKTAEYEIFEIGKRMVLVTSVYKVTFPTQTITKSAEFNLLWIPTITQTAGSKIVTTRWA